MSEKEIFNYLFKIAKFSKDPKGIVSACLVDDNKILESAVSADDGVRHAEDILIELIQQKNISISENSILYCTLEPCNKRSNPKLRDCANLIISSGIKNVVFGARDPDHSEVTHKKLSDSNISIQQVNNPDIIKKCAELFNFSVLEEHAGNSVKLKPIK